MASTLHARGSGDRKEDQKKDQAGPEVKSRHIISEHIDVGVPAEVAFEQWTQYDKWSKIFKNESAQSADKGGSGNRNGGTGRQQKSIEVSAKIGPSSRQWTAQVVDVEPDHRIRWRSKGPLKASGTTTFHHLDDRLTRIMVEIEYQPTGFLETVGNFFRMQRRRVRRDLRLFKHYIEVQGGAGGDGRAEEEDA